MDESAMNGLGLKKLNGSDAENQNQCVVSVEGYDTSLQTYYLKLILEKHFSPCGKITDVSLFRDEETGLLESCASIFFDGHGADEKALELNGSYLETYLGVCKIVVVRENYLDYTDGDDDSDDMKEKVEEVEKAKEKEEEEEEEYGLSVLGFDACASKHDIKIKLCEHLYSCGEVTEVFVCGHGRFNSECFAMVYIMGRDVPDRARKLGGEGISKLALCVQQRAKALPLLVINFVAVMWMDVIPKLPWFHHRKALNNLQHWTNDACFALTHKKKE